MFFNNNPNNFMLQFLITLKRFSKKFNYRQSMTIKLLVIVLIRAQELSYYILQLVWLQ